MAAVNFQSRVYIDWDYTLGGTIDFTTSGDEITQYRQGVDIRIGGQPGSLMARVGTCAITVNNASTYFSPRRQFGPYAGKLLPMKPVKVTATDGTTTWTVFTGWTRKFTPMPDRRGERKAKIECFDWLGVVQAANLDIPLCEDISSSQLALHVLNYALKAPIATAVYSVTANLADGDTVGINGTTYTAKTTPAAANHVQIGSSAASGRYDTIKAMVAAINGWDDPNLFYAGTTQPAGVRARLNDSYYQLIQVSDPVRRYRLAESAGVTAYDLGSNAANATYVGSPTLGSTGMITNDSATAITLDGTARYLTVPTLEFDNRSFSIAFIFKPAATPPANQDLFSIFSSFTTNKAFYIRYNDSSNGLLSVRFYGDGLVNSAALVAGTAYHVLVTYDYSSSTLSLYIDGVLIGTATSAGPFTGTAPTIQIAAFTAAGATYVKGTLQDVDMWLRVVSADEAADHAAARTAAPSPGFTIFSQLRGAIGNTYTSTESSAAITVSGATLSGGSDTPNMTTSFDTGLRTFPYAGDDWEGEKVSAYNALQSVVESERGRFYVKRGGTAVFENYAKQFTATWATPVLTTYGGAGGEVVIGLEGDLSADDGANAVMVRFTPRSEGSTGVVAKITSPIKVPGRWGQQNSDGNKDKPWVATGHPVGDPGQMVINLPYTDPDTGQRIGAKNLIAPLVPTTDWTANEAADGSMVDYTTYSPQQLFFTLAPKASGVDIFIKNTALGVLYVRSLQVRGTKITRYDAQTVTREDVSSIALYGRKVKQISLALESDSNFATAIAEYELSRASDPYWKPKRVSWRNLLDDGSANKVLAAELGDSMLLHEYQTMDDLNQIQVRIVGISYKFGLKNELNTDFDIEVVDDRVFGVYGGTLAVWDTARWTI